MLQNIPTGCKSIDKVLGGGIPSQSISLIYGEPETGKTALAMQCAANCAEKGCKTLFIDCDGTFSVRRLSQIVHENFSKIADKIILMRPDNFREQTLVIDQIVSYLNRNFGLLVIDTATSLYRVKVAESPDKAFELNRELNRQLALLAQVAKTQKIAVLLTSQVRSVFDVAQVSVEPVATRVVKFWADVIIALKPTESSQIIKAILEKNPKGTQPLSYTLRIDKTGIHEHLTR